jgi:hypothetical protein
MTRPLLIVLCAAVLAGCSPGGPHVAEATVAGVDIKVTLTPMHAYLAEYTRVVEVSRGSTRERKEISPDSGGYAWVVLRSRDGQLELHDVTGVALSIPLSEPALPDQYLGRFDFDPRRVYTFIPASADPNDPAAALKG